MILYVNGDHHSAAAWAAVPYRLAEDDANLWWMGVAPHPGNQEVSYGNRLAQILKARLILDTETGGSVDQIISGSRKFVGSNKFKEQLIVIIGWPEITPAISEFHDELNTLEVPHIFFSIKDNNQEPFLIPEAYLSFLSKNGFQNDNGYINSAGHLAWAAHLIPYLTKIL